MNMYEVIGNKIRSSLNLFAGDVIVWLSLDGMPVTTLYRIDDGYGQWEDDWYEGQKDVQLIDYCLLDALKPVTHAHWETDNYGYAILNEAGNTLYLAGVPCSRCHVTGHTNWNYCPNCGAIMDEEVE